MKKNCKGWLYSIRIIYCSNILKGTAFLLQGLAKNDSKGKRYKAKNLIGSNYDMGSYVHVVGPSSSGSDDLFGFSSRSRTFTNSPTTSTTGRHLGFKRDFISHTAFRGIAEGKLTFKVKCQGIIIKNTIKCSNESKFPLECPQIAFRRFRKSKFFLGSMSLDPLSSLCLNIINSETPEYAVHSH